MGRRRQQAAYGRAMLVIANGVTIGTARTRAAVPAGTDIGAKAKDGRAEGGHGRVAVIDVQLQQPDGVGAAAAEDAEDEAVADKTVAEQLAAAIAEAAMRVRLGSPTPTERH